MSGNRWTDHNGRDREADAYWEAKAMTPPDQCQECDAPLDDADDNLHDGLCPACYREGQNAAEHAYHDELAEWENSRDWGAR